jgi:curli biogenesis system outer membrane secretion channel CsgG
MKMLPFILSAIISFLPLGDAAALENLKKTVAVFDFENDSGYRSAVRLGDDFTVQLTDALVQSGKFNVLTREDLDVVFAEQDLAASGRMAKSTTARKGKAIPAQILIKGKITEFEENTSGGGQGFSIKGVSLGTKKSTASMAVIIQLIDSTTGEVLDSKRVEGEARSGGLSVGYSGSFDLSSSNFKKTPLGKAVQMSIDQAVEYISKKLSEVPWKGKVVTLKEGVVFINAGENANVQVGDTFQVLREGEPLIDPDTGIDLGSEATKLADIKITDVQPKFSKAQIEGVADTEIAAGDLIRQ